MKRKLCFTFALKREITFYLIDSYVPVALFNDRRHHHRHQEASSLPLIATDNAEEFLTELYYLFLPL